MERVADRVVIVVLDGLRPDMVAGHMPNLAAFAAAGLRFDRARSVFPSLTRVCTATLATGSWPARHGIVANAFHRPDLLADRALDTARREDLERLGAAGGGLLGAPGLGERLAASGLRLGIVHGGSAGSAFLAGHRAAELPGHWTVSVHGAAMTVTPGAQARAEAAAGPPPPPELPRRGACAWAAEVAIALGLGAEGPEVLLVWLPEPDTAFHYCGIGSGGAAGALAAADAAFGRIADAALARPRTALLALSDHGQIGTGRRIDLAGRMRADGLPAAETPGEGVALLLTGGRTGEVRPVPGTDPALLSAAADWLMAQPETGMVIGAAPLAERVPGLLPLALLRGDHPRAAPLLFVLGDGPGPDRAGLAGLGLHSGGVPDFGGMHGGLHPLEMATWLAAAIPGGRRGRESLPVALPDIAPSVLALLGLAARGMDGAPLPLLAAGTTPAVEEVHEAGRPGFRQRVVLAGPPGRLRLMEGGRTG